MELIENPPLAGDHSACRHCSGPPVAAEPLSGAEPIWLRNWQKDPALHPKTLADWADCPPAEWPKLAAEMAALESRAAAAAATETEKMARRTACRALSAAARRRAFWLRGYIWPVAIGQATLCADCEDPVKVSARSYDCGCTLNPAPAPCQCRTELTFDCPACLTARTISLRGAHGRLELDLHSQLEQFQAWMADA